MSWSEEAQVAMIKKKIKVADLCKQTGYCRQHISSIIHGKYDPMPRAAVATISNILEIEPPEM